MKQHHPVTTKRDERIGDQGPVWLSAQQLELRFGLTKATIYRLIQSGLFPRQVKIGVQAVRWHRQTVEEWEAGKLAEVSHD